MSNRPTALDQLAERLSRAERAIDNNSRMLAHGIRDLDARLSVSSRLSEDTRIDAGSLSDFSDTHRRHRQGRAPDLAMPLIERLKDDFLYRTAEGKSLPYVGVGNMLRDTAFEGVYGDTDVGTSYASISHWFEAKRTSTGTTPATREIVGDPLGRQEQENPTSSSWCEAYLDWTANGATGTSSIAVRDTGGVGLSDIMPRDRYLVASVRASMQDDYEGGTFARPTSVTLTMAIEDSSGTVVAESEPQDMLAAMDQKTVALVSCGVEAIYDPPEIYTWRATVTVVSGTVAGGIAVVAAVRLWEPSMTFSEEVSPQSYQPAIGAWIPNRLESIIDTDSTTVPVIALYDPASPASPRFTMDGPSGAMTWLDSSGTPVGRFGYGAAGAAYLGAVYITTAGFLAPAQLTASVNDYAPTGIQGAAVLYLTSNGAYSVTGIVAPDPSGHKVLLIYNASAFTLTLSHNSASSAVANRFGGFGGANISLTTWTGVLCVYYGSWRAMLRGS